jgi:hypothetical protein
VAGALALGLVLKEGIGSFRTSSGPTPTISSFKPTSGGVGTVVRIRGTDLSDATSVSFNGTPSTEITVISETTITAVVPAGATTGFISVAHGNSSESAEVFTVEPTPTISGFEAPAGGIRSTVTIHGTNFTGTKKIKFNGQPSRTFEVLSSAEIEVAVPVGATTGPISITTPGGTATSRSAFTVVPKPTISDISPSSGGIGTAIMVTGTNFTGASAVSFGPVPATAFSVASANTIMVVIPVGSTTGGISITTLGGTATRSRFKIVPAPTIEGFVAGLGPIGTVVRITGTDLARVSAVSFNGVPATTFNSPNSRLIKATVPIGATSGFISVTTPGGTTSSRESFTVLAP